MLKTVKKMLAIVLVTAMLITTSAVILPPSLIGYTQKEAEPPGNTFLDLGFDENLIDRDALEDNLPYRDNSALKSVRELYVGGAGIPFTFGKNGKLGESPSQSNGYSMINQPGGASFVFPNSLTYEGATIPGPLGWGVYDIYEGDFDGDGRKDELAALCMLTYREPGPFPWIPGALRYMTVLCVGSAEDNTTPMAVVRVVNRLLINKNYLKCGDVNGDGLDEIIVASYGKSQIDTYYLKEGSKETDNWRHTENWQDPVQTPFGATWTHGDNSYTYPISDLAIGKTATAFSMDVGDVDRDGCEDIVYIASSMWNGNRNGAYRSSYVLYGTRNVATPEYTQHQFNNFGITEGKGDDSGDGNEAFVRFGVTISDMDGDVTPEILVAYMQVYDLFYSSNRGAYIGMYYNVSRLNYTGRNTNYDAEHIYKSRMVKKSGKAGEKDPSCSDPAYSSALQIARLENDYNRHQYGPVSSKSPFAWGSIIVNGDINSYAITNNPDTYKREYNFGKGDSNDPSYNLFFSGTEYNGWQVKRFYYSMDNNIQVHSIRQTTVTGSADGFAIHYSTDEGKYQHIRYFDSTGGGGYAEVNSGTEDDGVFKNDGMSRSSEGLIYYALPDIDFDSIYLHFEDHNFFWSDPRVLAALASPPYFSGLPSENYSYGSTSYGTSRETSTGTVKSNSNSAGAYVSAELQVGGSFVKAVFETEVSYEHTWTHATEETKTYEYTSGFSTPAGENGVVLATNAFDVYNYTMYAPEGDSPDGSKIEGQLYTVVVPRGNATQVLQLSQDTYEEIQANDDKGILPDLSGVFQHTVGSPNTYSGVPSGDFVKADSVMRYGAGATFPNSDGWRTLGTAISTATEESWTEGNTVDARLGAGVVIGSDDTPNFTVTAGITYSHDWEKGKMVGNSNGVFFEGVVYGQGSQMHSGFNWELLTYTYTDNPTKDPSKDTHEFPVVSYVVSGYRFQAGHTPGEVVVGEQVPNPVDVVTSGTKDVTYKVLAPGIEKDTPVELNGAPTGMELETTIISSADQNIDISINSNVKAGSYPLTLTIDNVDSNVFYLNVDGGPSKVTVSSKDGTKTQPTKEYRAGEIVNIDVSEWKEDNKYFSWVNDHSDIIPDFDIHNPVFSFVMPYKNVDFVADFHNHEDKIARLKAVPDGSYTAANITTTQDVTEASPTKNILFWADFGNGLNGEEYSPVVSDKDYIADAIWSVSGANSQNTRFISNSRIAGSPSATLLIGEDEDAQSITIRATSAINPAEFKEYTLGLFTLPIMVEATPAYIEFPEEIAGVMPHTLWEEITIKNLNTGGLRPNLEITGITIKGEDAQRYWLEDAEEIIGSSIAAGATKTFTALVASADSITEAGSYEAYVEITVAAPDDPKDYNNVIVVPMFYRATEPPPREMTLNPESHVFPQASPEYEQQEAKEFTIFTQDYEETLDPLLVPITGLAVSLNGTDFEISTPLSQETITITPGDNIATFSVRPKTGLSPGLYTDTLTVTSDNGMLLSSNISFFVDDGSTVTEVVVSPQTADVYKGATQAFTAQVNGTGSPAQGVTWTVEGGIAGTSISSGGVLTVAAGETATTLTVRATSLVDTSKSGTASVTVLEAPLTPLIITTSLPGGNTSEEYNQTLQALGQTPITWSITQGNLPTGLSLSETTGTITGTPTVGGTFTFTVKATNEAGEDTKELSIVVQGDTQAPTGKISIKGKDFTTFADNIIFDLFLKDAQTVSIVADDIGEDVTIEYYIAAEEKTVAELSGVTWTAYPEGGFPLPPNNQYIVYAKLTGGTSGQVSYINSSGVVVFTDSEASVLGSFPKDSQEDLTVNILMNGNTVKEVTLNGSAVEASNYTLDANTITFKNAYMKTLPDGDCEFTVSYYPLGKTQAPQAGSDTPGITTLTISKGKTDQTPLVISGLSSFYTYGDADFNLTAIGGDGEGAVSFALASGTGVASVSTSGQVSILKAGTFKVKVTKAADEDYNAASTTSDEITVTQATPTVTLTAEKSGADVILRATVAKVGVGQIPSGTVTFKQDGNPLGTAIALVDGIATYTLVAPGADAHDYEAAYSGQPEYYDSAAGELKGYSPEKLDQVDFAITDPGAKTYGDADFALSSTGGNGQGAVTYSAAEDNGVLSITADGQVSIIGAGTALVTAVKAGDATYKDATATLQITVARKAMDVPTPATGLEYNGTEQTGVASGQGYTIEHNTATNAGIFFATVTPDGNHQWSSGEDVTAARVVGFSIIGKAITVTADNKEKYFGAADPVLTYSVSPALIAGDSLVGSLKYEGTAVGAYDIVEDEPISNPNYQVTFVKGTMTIKQTPEVEEVIKLISDLPDEITSDDVDDVTDATKAFDALSDEQKEQIPQDIKDKLSDAQEQAGEINHTDWGANITVSGDDLPWNVQLVVSVVPKSSSRYAPFFNRLTDKKLLILYDIKLINTLTGEDYELPAGQTVTVKINDIDLTDAKDVAIAHQKASGSLQTITANVKNSSLTFIASSLGLYGVTAQADKQPDPTDSTQPTTTGTSPAGGKGYTYTYYPDGKGGGSPKTGDSSNMMLWILLSGACMMVLGGTAVNMRRRYRRVNK